MASLFVETRIAARRAWLIVSGVLLLLAGGMLMWRLLYPFAVKYLAAGPSQAPATLPAQEVSPASASVGTPISLRASYNAETGDVVSMNTQEHPNNLGEFPTGEQVFAGVKFSVQGVIHLGSIYPKLVQGINVGGRCQRLHLLHGTAGTTTEGAPCAGLTLHYADGSTAELVIEYGEHVRANKPSQCRVVEYGLPPGRPEQGSRPDGSTRQTLIPADSRGRDSTRGARIGRVRTRGTHLDPVAMNTLDSADVEIRRVVIEL